MRRLVACALLLGASPLAARDTIMLDRDWQVRIDPADTAAARAHPREAEWFPAQVPGSVQQDLIRARRAPDPFIGTSERAIQWAGLSAWQFRTRLNITAAMMAHDHLDLVFDGLDTFATVSVNGQPLLKADNAHRRWRAEARSLLHPGINEISVLIASPIRTLQPMVLKEAHPLPGEYDSAFGDEPKGVQTSPYIRKPKYQYGWDWGPRIVTAGLWQPARLEAWDDARLDHFRIAQDALSDAEARLTAHATIVADTTKTVTLAANVTAPDGSRQSVERTVTLTPGINPVTIPLTIAKPRR